MSIKMRRRSAVFLAGACLIVACSSPPVAVDGEADVSAYGALRKGYAERNESLIGSAHAADARVALDDEIPRASATGSEAIQRLYGDLLGRFPDDQRLDLNFRIEGRRRDGERLIEVGAYRLKAGRSAVGFGRFETVREAGTGVIVSKRSLPGSRDAFERMAAPILFDSDIEDLDPAFYGRLTGRYALDGGCSLVVTHSVVRLMVRNTCDSSWRGLERISGTTYRMGDTVRPVAAFDEVEFRLPSQGRATHLTISGKASKVTATRADPYTREDVTFTADDGVQLAGTIWHPGRVPIAATVLVHGSGPQDRNGYASIISVMADELAAAGHVVLAFDKRGVGLSGGDRDRAGFDVLASDAEAARKYLAAMPALRDLPSGFAGSSQAGWVVAEAIRAGASPAHVILVGAAGSALTVEEQNLYNTEVRMRCAGVAPDLIDLALRQQRAFFDLLAGRSSNGELDRLTEEGRKAPALADWLFPASSGIDRASGDWFNVLDLDFDPRPVWADYAGDLTLIHPIHDDSTPTLEVVERWEVLNRERTRPASIVELDHAQHIGLRVSDICETDFGGIAGFDPAFFDALQAAASRHSTSPAKN